MKMFGVWILVLCLTTGSDSYMMTSLMNSIKTFTGNFPWLPFIKETANHSETTSAASRFQFDSTTPAVLNVTEPLTEFSDVYIREDSTNNTNYQNKFVFVTKNSFVIKDLDFKNKEESRSKNTSENIIKNAEDAKEYSNYYNDLLDKVQSFITMNNYSNVKRRFPGGLLQSETEFNVTYVMPIPNTNIYHEIKIINLNQYKFDEINKMVQEYFKEISYKESLSTSFPGSSMLNVGIDRDQKQVTRSLKDSTSSELDTKTASVQYKPEEYPIHTSEDLRVYLGKVFTSNGYDSFVKSFVGKKVYGESFGKTTPSVNTSLPLIMNKNGFHAEIATDYVPNNSEELSMDKTEKLNSQLSKLLQEKETAELKLNQANNNQGRNKTISPVHGQEEINTPFQTRSKRPIMNFPGRKGVKFGLLPTESSILTSQNLYSIKPNEPVTDNVNLSFNQTNTNYFIDKTNKPKENTFIDSQDWKDISKLNLGDGLLDFSSKMKLNRTTDNSTSMFNDSLNIMQVANWIIDMKKRLVEEEKRRIEQLKNNIKKYLGVESKLLGRETEGSVMKINKEDNNLQEIRNLMLDYFVSLGFFTQDTKNNGSILLLESVMNSTNVFELMESSNRFVQAVLKSKLETKLSDPTEFVKNIVKKQLENCEKILLRKHFDSSSMQTESPDFAKNIKNKRFMAFTNCMNFKILKCIKGFRFWLEKRKYHQRKQFKLERAYERYEMERNLYCLRTHNLSSLGSNPKGIRVKPGMKIQRRYGKKLKQNGPQLKLRKQKNERRRLQFVNRIKANKNSNRPTTGIKPKVQQSPKYQNNTYIKQD